LTKTAIKISNRPVGYISIIAKILFQAKQILKIARDSNLLEKKIAAKEIFGSNLYLASRAVCGEPQNQWAALCAAQKMASKKSERLVLVYLYNSARTYFIKNS